MRSPHWPAGGEPVLCERRPVYLATRVLLGEGFDARNLSGGWLTLQATVHPNL